MCTATSCSASAATSPSRAATASITDCSRLWSYHAETLPNEVRDTDWMLFSWIVGGGSSSDGEENYFWIFPLGGRGKDVLSYDEFNFVLWPLYIDNRKDERFSHHVLWPIFGWQSGSERGWRVWPLYGTSEWPGRYRRGFFLWPFWTTAADDLDKTHPRYGWFLWPLVGRNTQEDWNAWQFLWPFFGYASKPSTGYRSFQFWPFVKIHDGTDSAESPNRVRRFLPFYLHFEDGQTEMTRLAVADLLAPP